MRSDPSIETGLLRVRPDDPDYLRQAAAEAAYWEHAHPLGLEAAESRYRDGAVERYVNTRFTGDPNTEWAATIVRWGSFRRGLILGLSSPNRDVSLLRTNPRLEATVLDLSAGGVQRRATLLGARFPGRVETGTADLNFLYLAPESYDLIVSSSTIHHVTNLEHLAFQINRALTTGGYFFLEDYVGEPGFRFSDVKKRLYEIVYARDVGRQKGRKPGLIWYEVTDISPFCGVRSHEILGVFRSFLDEVQVRTAAALTAPMGRALPADWDDIWARMPRWKLVRARILDSLGVRRRRLEVAPGFLKELTLVGDTSSEAGVILPGIAFGVYRKRQA